MLKQLIEFNKKNISSMFSTPKSLDSLIEGFTNSQERAIAALVAQQTVNFVCELNIKKMETLEAQYDENAQKLGETLAYLIENTKVVGEVGSRRFETPSGLRTYQGFADMITALVENAHTTKNSPDKE